MTMNAQTFSFPQQWTSQDLADAVPLRLHELFDFDASRDGPVAPCANSHPRSPQRDWRRPAYRLVADLPALFRIR
jgi:hypothetical protein